MCSSILEGFPGSANNATESTRMPSAPIMKMMLSGDRRTNRLVGTIRKRAAGQFGPRVRDRSELNFSIRPWSGACRCRRLGPMDNDGLSHGRTGSRGPNGYRIVFGRRLWQPACQYRFRRRWLGRRHGLGNRRRLRRCCRLKPSSRHKPSGR